MSVLDVQAVAGTRYDRRFEVLGVGEEHLGRSWDGCELRVAGCEAVTAAVRCIMFYAAC